MAQQPPSFKTVFVFLDTDKYCSPFDMLVAIDAFPDSMIFKYENVNAEDAPKIVFDLLFPRGPEGAKHTKVFINGSNFEMVEKVVAATQKAMKSAPWGNSIIVDPRGGYSTAAAAVAKTFGASMEKGLGQLRRQKRHSPSRHRTSRADSRTHLRRRKSQRNHHQPRTRKRTSSRLQNQPGMRRTKSQSRRSHKARADSRSRQRRRNHPLRRRRRHPTAFSSRPSKAPKCKIVADINAIKPLGVEGLGPNDE